MSRILGGGGGGGGGGGVALTTDRYITAKEEGVSKGSESLPFFLTCTSTTA